MDCTGLPDLVCEIMVDLYGSLWQPLLVAEWLLGRCALSERCECANRCGMSPMAVLLAVFCLHWSGVFGPTTTQPAFTTTHGKFTTTSTEKKMLKCYILAKFNHHSAHPGQNYVLVMDTREKGLS